jgi:hypothetical protein
MPDRPCSGISDWKFKPIGWSVAGSKTISKSKTESMGCPPMEGPRKHSAEDIGEARLGRWCFSTFVSHHPAG